MKFLRALYAICHKDLLSELRKREILNTLFFFSAIIIFLFSFAIGTDPTLLKKMAPGLLWLVVFFSAILALEKSYQSEMEEGCFDHLLLYSRSHHATFLGKLLTNFIFIALVGFLVMILMTILFNLPAPQNIGSLFLTFFLGILGVATLGTFYAALIAKTKAKATLLPLLLFPMLTPLLLAAVYATQLSLEESLINQLQSWLQMLVVFDAVFLSATLLVIGPLMEA
ncbi:MAG: heme exporter protein CcmB [Deltaproteobacteria bacterium]|nr:heme exporter protein CcmB [Deltaproteobacteria bacterium]